MFFEGWWAVPYQDISEVRVPGRGWGAFVGTPQYCCIRITISGKKFERNFRQKVAEKAL